MSFLKINSALAWKVSPECCEFGLHNADTVCKDTRQNQPRVFFLFYVRLWNIYLAQDALLKNMWLQATLRWRELLTCAAHQRHDRLDIFIAMPSNFTPALLILPSSVIPVFLCTIVAERY